MDKEREFSGDSERDLLRRATEESLGVDLTMSASGQ